MDESRADYPRMLSSLQPSQAVAVFNDRIRHVSSTNTDIADWLQERRRVEEAYAQGLRRLARKTPPNDSSDLGIFTTPWQSIVTATEALAESHSLLARRVETDVERPLRDFTSQDREMQHVSTVQGNLASLARDVDTSQAKAGKKPGRSRRGTNASDDVGAATGQWESQAPYVFEMLQVVDESRFNRLRDVLTQFQTHEIDRVEKSRGTAEQCLNTLLNVDTRDEIKAFAVRSVEGASAPSARTRSRTNRRQSRMVDQSFLAPPPTLNPDNDDRTSQRSQSIHEEKKSRLGGLRRLGTVISRRRHSAIPPIPKVSPSKNRGGTKLGSSTELSGESPSRSQARERQLPETPSRSGQRSVTPSAGAVPPLPATVQPERTSSRNYLGRSSSQASEANGISTRPSGYGMTNGGQNYSSYQQPQSNETNGAPELVAPPQLHEEPTGTPSSFETSQQSNDPISQAQAEAASFGDMSGQPYKVDIRDAPIREEGNDAQMAMSNVANTLRAQAPKRAGTNRGRRDVRNTIFVPNPTPENATTTAETPPQLPMPGQNASTAFSSTGPLLPPSSSSLSALHSAHGQEHSISDSQSIRSGRSLGAGAGPVKHPDLSSPGLQSSIVEVVNATLEQGIVSRASVLGELALAFNASESSAPPKEIIRLENFSVLEKVAPNPAFISQLSSDRPGDYSVDVGSIASAGPKPQIAFKYQIHLDESNSGNVSRHVPLLITPTWKVESKQTSVILHYSVNPAFIGAASGSSVKLSNVLLILHLSEGTSGAGKPLSCQSKPAGTFSKERALIYWRMDDLNLVPGGAAQKAIARFTTDGEAKPGKVEARFEVSKGMSELGVSRAAGTGGAGDPFADEGAGAWREVNCARKLVSGTYVGV